MIAILLLHLLLFADLMKHTPDILQHSLQHLYSSNSSTYTQIRHAHLSVLSTVPAFRRHHLFSLVSLITLQFTMPDSLLLVHE
jgi:hypothetical protein